jgi:RLL motif-containing protein 1
VEKYRKPADDYESRSVTPTNPIDGLDIDSNEFKDGVKQLARLLKVAAHPTNHLCTLSAISLVIKNHISIESNDKSEDKVKLKTNNRKLLDNKSMQLKTGSNDSVLTNSAKILRLLYINDLRELQTTVNEMIASIQSITANPKTDTTLGKVGS